MASPQVHIPVYTCYDPSLRAQYPELGTMVSGYRIPGGGDLERGVNRFLPVFARKLRSIPGDLVHIWSVSLAALIGFRSDVIVTVPDIAKLTTRFYPRLPSYLHNRMLHYLPRARAIICYTEAARREIVEGLRLPPDLVHVTPPSPSIGPPPFPLPRTNSPPTALRPWELLYVATDRRHKNIEFFLRVLARLDGRFRGLVVTQPTSRTIALSRQIGVADRIEFRSGVADLASVFRGADLLVHPSLHEGFGLPLLEGMSQGLPVVASNRTCIPEVVGNGGQVLDPTDPTPWVDAIEALTDPARYKDASRMAVERASSFSVEKTRAALMGVYDSARR
ncbi:MAG: glycosyltransferase [Thermoplasmata archaeon]|nr:glycosyltransferase [Thermoplasmata archaeon]